MVAKMECTFYVNPNGTLANLYLWFVPALDTSKLFSYGEYFQGILKEHSNEKQILLEQLLLGYEMSTHTSYIPVEHRHLPSLMLW